jgi:hypothetical protein
MKPLNPALFEAFINQEVDRFLEARFKTLDKMRLKDILGKNPYLFRAKNLTSVEQLMDAMIEARLSSSEEKKFGDFLERLAIFVSQETSDGRKSTARGLDLEFFEGNTLYLVAIKSGPNWGNSSQYQSLEANFKTAKVVQRQANSGFNIQPVLGICYGKSPDVDNGLYIKKTGQRFWQFLSGEIDFHLKLMELIGRRVDLYQRDFMLKRNELKLSLIKEFESNFVMLNGSIDWQKVVQFNSGN